ncbi:MAG: energy transducer TonB [bacterium]
MKNFFRLVIPLALILPVICGCQKTPRKVLVVSEVTHFAVQGNGRALNLPIFAGTLDMAQIAREISLAQYYYDKLSSVYDFKSFTVIGSGSSETLIEKEQRFHEPQSVYCHEDSLSRLQLSLTGFANGTARYVFRMADKSSGQVRDHAVEVPAGQSASIGSLYDSAKNRGYILAVSALALEITPEIAPKQLLDFLQLKNTPRGSRELGGFKAGDQRWADEVFGLGKVRVPARSADSTNSGEPLVPYDTPPEPIGGMMALMRLVEYPVSALRDSVEGQVLIELEISEQGKVMSSRLKKGVRGDLDSAAIQAMHKAQFKPAVYRNRPVAVKVTVPVMFKLKK